MENQEVVISTNYLIPVDEKVFGETTVAQIKESKLNSFDKEVCLAAFGIKKIKAMEAKDAGTALQVIINRTIFECGMTVQDIPLMTQIIIKDIFRDYSLMTVDEVAIAFRMGVREEWGELKGMNIRQFYVWLRQYKNHVKKKAIAKLLIADKPKNAPKTEVEREKIRKSWLNLWCVLYDEWFEGKDVILGDAGSVFYNYICDNEMLTLTLDEKKELYNRAEVLFKVNRDPKKADSIRQGASFADEVKKLQEGDKSVSMKIKSDAKKLAIRHFFSILKKKKTTLREVIAENEK